MNSSSSNIFKKVKLTNTHKYEESALKATLFNFKFEKKTSTGILEFSIENTEKSSKTLKRNCSQISAEIEVNKEEVQNQRSQIELDPADNEQKSDNLEIPEENKQDKEDSEESFDRDHQDIISTEQQPTLLEETKKSKKRVKSSGKILLKYNKDSLFYSC